VKVLKLPAEPPLNTIAKTTEEDTTLTKYNRYLSKFNPKKKNIEIAQDICMGSWNDYIDELRSKLPRCLLW